MSRTGVVDQRVRLMKMTLLRRAQETRQRHVYYLPDLEQKPAERAKVPQEKYSSDKVVIDLLVRACSIPECLTSKVCLETRKKTDF